MARLAIENLTGSLVEHAQQNLLAFHLQTWSAGFLPHGRMGVMPKT